MFGIRNKRLIARPQNIKNKKTNNVEAYIKIH